MRCRSKAIPTVNSSAMHGWPCRSPIRPPGTRRPATRVGPVFSRPPTSRARSPTTFRRRGARSASCSITRLSTGAAWMRARAIWAAARWRSTRCRDSTPEMHRAMSTRSFRSSHFPVDSSGRTYLVQDVTYYSKTALSNDFRAWRNGGPACSGRFNDHGGVATQTQDKHSKLRAGRQEARRRRASVRHTGF